MTTNAAYMWLAPWQPGKQTHSLSITIAPPSAPPVAVTALRVWNYNKSADDAERGVRARPLCSWTDDWYHLPAARSSGARPATRNLTTRRPCLSGGSRPLR